MNGILGSRFNQSRGGRQGDPISLYLFVLTIEHLGHVILAPVEKKTWVPFWLVQSGLPISYMFFFDDLILYAKSTRDQTCLIDEILSDFGSYSNHRANKLKSQGYCANNFEIDWVRWEGAGDGKYSVKSLVSKCLDFSSSKGGRLAWDCSSKGGGFYLACNSSEDPGDPGTFLLAWHDANISRSSDSIWHFFPFAILWSIWLFRNDIIFANGRLDVVQIFYLIRTQVAVWYKAKFSDCSCTVDELISNPSVADSLSYSLSKVRKNLRWEAPPCGFLKLNIDGVMEGNGGKGGIRGLLRNNLGICLEKFSLPIGPGPLILAELEAILHGLKFFFSSRWCEKFRLVLECDCLTAIDWFSNASPCPQAFDLLVKSCRDLIYTNSVVLRHIPRYINLEADSLAKKGIG
ncbi:hypothetical protein V6N11_031136 [Hibiscus sabdariffa]|uniref:RNase H type-1 domain-containing protein n=2 Tax=Hibiscus sabdariffa TaxID=183260 RepID=A0ABR1ZE94_9ROSI